MELDPDTLLFWLKKLAAVLALPPVLPLLPIVLGLLTLRHRPRLGLALAWAGVALNLLLILPSSVGWLVAQVEYPHTLDRTRLREAQAIVVLGAGKRTHAPEFGGETVNRLALERLRYAPQLARETRLPVPVSGGAPHGDTPRRLLMQRAAGDRTTACAALGGIGLARHARERRLLGGASAGSRGKQDPLVTHAMHMNRARADFEAGARKCPAPPPGWAAATQRATRRCP